MPFLLSFFSVGDLWQPREPFFLKEHKASTVLKGYGLYDWPDVELPPYDVRKYVIRMGIWDGTVQYAHVTVKLVGRSATDTVLLHFGWPSTDSVKYNGSPVAFSTVGTDTAQKLVVPLPSPLNPGDTAFLDVFYHGTPPSSGCFSYGGGLTIETPTWAYADNEPYGFRCWVPSYDQPYEKADEGVEFYITTDSSLEVVANGVLVDTTASSGLKTWHYVHSHPITPYLITFGIRDLIANEYTWTYGSITMPVRAWILASDTSSWGDSLPYMLTAFSVRYGPYPFADEKYEQSNVLPGGWAMEDQTNSFFGGYYSTWVQAHELAHQWWGDAVTCGTFKDIWLNEGFATYSEIVWREHVGGWSAYRSYYDERVDSAIFAYASNPGKPVYNPGPNLSDAFSVYTYNKGAAVLHMLRYILGKDTSLFFGALRYYRSRHEGSYALTSDFTDDVQTYTGRDLNWFFNEWVYEPGWPVYDVRWNRFDEGGSWSLLLWVEQTQPVGAPTFKMPIEVKVFTPSGDTTVVIWDSLDVQHFWITLSDRPDSILWDPENWVLEQHTLTYDPALSLSERAKRKLLRRDITVRVSRGWVTVLPPLSGEYIAVYDRSGRRVAYGKNGLRLRLSGGVYYAKSGGKIKTFVVR